MYEAIANNRPDIVEALILAGASPNYDWGPKAGTPLSNAAQFGHLEVVRRLVERGAEVNISRASGFSALYRAVVYGHRETAAYLRQKGAVLTDRDRKALRDLGIRED
jgi:ankyrin repeat protein